MIFVILEDLFKVEMLGSLMGEFALKRQCQRADKQKAAEARTGERTKKG